MSCVRISVGGHGALTKDIDDTLVDTGEQDEEILDEESQRCHRDLVVNVICVELGSRSDVDRASQLSALQVAVT